VGGVTAPLPPADPATRRRRRRRLAAARLAVSIRAALPAGPRRRERGLVCGAAAVLTAVGVRVEVSAPAVPWPRPGTGRLVVANRASRLDDLVLATVLRGAAVVHPEQVGGPTLGRFRAAPFQAAVDAGVPVCPVAVHWRTGPGHRPAGAVGGRSLRSALHHALAVRGLVAEVHLLPPLAPSGTDGAVLAALAEYAVAGVLEARAPAGTPRPDRTPAAPSGVHPGAAGRFRDAPTVWRRRRLARR
jgi:1-acyl-sn-glycerol-3-phosphate acyltransferase